jgi:hypothetical protein
MQRKNWLVPAIGAALFLAVPAQSAPLSGVGPEVSRNAGVEQVHYRYRYYRHYRHYPRYWHYRHRHHHHYYRHHHHRRWW